MRTISGNFVFADLHKDIWKCNPFSLNSACGFGMLILVCYPKLVEVGAGHSAALVRQWVDEAILMFM